MRYTLIAFLFFVGPTMAQQAGMQQELDGAQALATTIVSNFRQQIITDQNLIAALRQQVGTLTKERDDLKLAVDAAKHDEVSPGRSPLPPK